MKNITINVGDSVLLAFGQAAKDLHLALIRNVENAILDNQDDKAIDLLKQVIRNIEAFKDLNKPVVKPEKVKEEKPVVMVELPLDTKEVMQGLFPTEEKKKRTRRKKNEIP